MSRGSLGLGRGNPGWVPSYFLIIVPFVLNFILKCTWVLGCTCFVKDVRPHVFKLDLKSLKCIFLG